jgi:hypothetical protein
MMIQKALLIDLSAGKDAHSIAPGKVQKHRLSSPFYAETPFLQ